MYIRSLPQTPSASSPVTMAQEPLEPGEFSPPGASLATTEPLDSAAPVSDPFHRILNQMGHIFGNMPDFNLPFQYHFLPPGVSFWESLLSKDSPDPQKDPSSHGSPGLACGEAQNMADSISDQIPLSSLSFATSPGQTSFGQEYPGSSAQEALLFAPFSGGDFESDDMLDVQGLSSAELGHILLGPSDPEPFGQDGEESMEGGPEDAHDGFSGFFG